MPYPINQGARCAATKVKGNRCGNSARFGDFCTWHDPKQMRERETARKAARREAAEYWEKTRFIRGVLQVAEKVSKANGWETRLAGFDEEGFRHLALRIRRPRPDAGFPPRSDVAGTLTVTLSDRVRLEVHPTSPMLLGFPELVQEIRKGLARLRWVKLEESGEVWADLPQVAPEEPAAPQVPQGVLLVPGGDDRGTGDVVRFLERVGLRPVVF